MEVKLKISDSKALSKTEASTTLEHVKFKDNIISKEDAKISLFFRGGSASGIIELSLKELEHIEQAVKEEKALKKTEVPEEKFLV